MLDLKFYRHPVSGTLQAELVLRDGGRTQAAVVAVIQKRVVRWKDVGPAHPMVRQEGKRAVTWRVGMVDPTGGAGYDADVFERPTLKAAKTEIAARLFIAVTGAREGEMGLKGAS